MGKEIEKKYLLWENGVNHTTEAFTELYDTITALVKDVKANGKIMSQGYMPLDKGHELADLLEAEVHFIPTEARLRNKAGRLIFNMKGDGGLVRNELPDYDVSQDVFEQNWNFTEGNRVEKIRLKVPYQGHTLEIDVFTDRLLITGEVEVDSVKEAENLVAIGKDVTEDQTYKNKNLASAIASERLDIGFKYDIQTSYIDDDFLDVHRPEITNHSIHRDVEVEEGRKATVDVYVIGKEYDGNLVFPHGTICLQVLTYDKGGQEIKAHGQFHEWMARSRTERLGSTISREVGQELDMDSLMGTVQESYKQAGCGGCGNTNQNN
jgi:adenylate cyclase